ncbi:MAG TPA: hypothetical protein DCS43_02580 [Verrucomicrobia bacterium]|nr:hypothetical protein [Verrucomicrobiota bacterium]
MGKVRRAVGVLMLGCGLGAEAEVAEISPSVHFNGAVGCSTAEHAQDLAVGHHDPTRTDGSVQGLELGASLRAGTYLQGFSTYTLHYGASEEWDGEWEEAFLKLVSLPGGVEIRGGRVLARFGALNATHLHGWDTVDMPLVSGLLLGEDGLILDGGDVTWLRKDRQLTFGAVAGYGRVLAHDHGGHEDEDAADHDDHADEHADHAHLGWDGDAGYGRIFAICRPNDFNQWTVGSSGAFGDNEADNSRSVLGVDLTYQWRAHGLEAGGPALRWTTEVMSALDAAAGLYSQAIWTWNNYWDTGLRLGAMDGEGEREPRFRASPVATWRPLGNPLVAMRLQYNYDDLGAEAEHTVWAQLGLSWGGGEVR